MDKGVPRGGRALHRTCSRAGDGGRDFPCYLFNRRWYFDSIRVRLFQRK